MTFNAGITREKERQQRKGQIRDNKRTAMRHLELDITEKKKHDRETKKIERTARDKYRDRNQNKNVTAKDTDLFISL